jgi:hypothetical protein
MRYGAMRYLLLTALATLLVGGGCSNGSSSKPDGGIDSGTTDTDSDVLVPLSGVEILVVIDNSIGMNEERAIMADALYSFVNTLMTPPDGSSHAAIDNIRVAITTTDMGLSWGGNPYTEGDGWPGTNPCSSSGDNGVFQTYADGTTWGDDLPCPLMNNAWAETSSENLNQSLADQAACLADQGTGGCGWEQQLQAAAAAMNRPDQPAFFHDDSLLLVLVVSNDDECSLEDGPGMFVTDEIQNPNPPTKKNLACGMHQEYLYSIEHYYSFYRARKNNADNAVTFASIVGVPVNDTCQGAGNEIDDCLDDPDMQFTEVLVENSQGILTYYWETSCERGIVTAAWPGRRYVELAQTFGESGYVSSICNEDWTPAMNDIAEMIFTTIEESP